MGKAQVNMIGLSKIVLIILLVGTVNTVSSGCASKPTPAVQGQVATVQRGNLSTDITGVGNLALSQKVDLPFEMDGTVAEVLVKVASSVEEGQLLARLDTSAWEENVANLERQVRQTERQLTSAKQTVISKQRDLLQAQINLNNAQLSLEQTEETSTDPLEIGIKQLQVELAQGKLDDAKTAVNDAATQGIEDAEQTLAEAQKALDDAKNASPGVKAPFSGFITSVNVAGGDSVKKGTVAMTIADPAKFEAEIMVSEVNILKVQVGGIASVLVEAMPGTSFPATVTQRAPSATIQSGVVNYKVKVELASLQPITQQQQPTTGNTSANITPGRFPQSFPSGNLTQEQIDQMRQRQQSLAGQSGGQFQTRQPGSQQAGRQQSQVLNTTTGSTGLAEGMTVTVSITTQTRNDVLLIPVQAVISQGGKTAVQVLNNGITEERPVQVGISNWQYAEITSGLSEGEQVVAQRVTAPTTSTTSRTQQGQGQSGGGIIPGMQRILR